MNKKIAFCLIIFLLTTIATATTRNVPTVPYPTIQAAIDDAEWGDLILVADGTYTGPGNRDLDFGGKYITVSSESGNPANCIIDCNELGRAFYFHNGEIPAAVVQGFTIKNGDAYYGGAIECEEASPTIDNCIITNNAAAYGGAIDFFYTSSAIIQPVIKNCIITNNTADYDGGAIECSSESSPIIENCLISGNITGGYGVIDCFEESSPAITNCTIVNNTGYGDRGGVHATDVSSPTIKSCIIWNNGDDIYGATATYSCVQDGDAGTGNINTDPMFRKGPYPSYGNYYLSQRDASQLNNSSCINAGGDSNDPNYLADTIFFGSSYLTTRTDNLPDSNTVDMGFHYPDSGIDVNYVLITGVDPNENHGTIEPNYPAPAGHSCKQFSEVSLTAIPDANYYVGKWTGTDDDNSTDVNNIVTMDANHIVTVKFSLTICRLTTYVIGSNGTIDPCYPGGHDFPNGSQVTLYAHPTDPNIYGVNRWFKGATGTFDINDSNTTVVYGPNEIYTTTIESDTTIAVEFKKYLLDTRLSGGYGAISPRRGYQPARKSVPITVTPDYSYRVKRWIVDTNDIGSTALTNTVIMSSDKVVTVELEAIPQYWLTVNVTNPNLGSIDPNGGWFLKDTNATLTATPTEGRRVKSWAINDANNQPYWNQPGWNVNTNTVIMDANNKVVTVTFEDSNSRVIHVFGDVNGIQNAITQANNGDTIKIHPGTYVGSGFIINKIITIVGDPEHPENVIIDCNGQDRNWGCQPVRSTGFDLWGGSTLNGVTIINSHTYSYGCGYADPHPGDSASSTSDNHYGAIEIYGNATVKNCIIRDCSVDIERAFDGLVGGDPNDSNTHSKNGGRGGNGGNAGGAGIYVYSGDPNIMNVLIEDCCAVGGDGGNGAIGFYRIPGPNDTYVSPGTAGRGGAGGSVYGAGIYIASGNAKLTDVTVRNCTARAGSGGNGADGIPIHNLFPNNGADGNLPGRINGAGIYCGGGSPVFTNCKVENCIGYGGKGGNGGDGGEADVNANYGGYGGLTTNPVAGQGDLRTRTTMGGAVFCSSSSAAKFTNCSFTGNKIYGSISGLGGISYLWEAEVQEEPRKNYRLAGLGAGAFCSTASSVRFNDCLFENNRTAYNQDFNDPNISDYDGEYTGNGGGLCLWYTSTSDINNCNLVQNSAPLGGGLYSIGSGINIRGCDITNNISMAGGGVLTLDSTGTISKSTITGNIAGTQSGNYPDTGGALFGTGGGIYALSTLLDINDSTIAGNHARLTGGGICFDGDTPFIQVPHIKNCLVTGNTATEEGGGIAAIYFAEPKIQNCTIAENIVSNVNSRGGGLFASYAANVIVKDTIFRANSGIDGSQIALSDGGPFTNMPANVIITYSDIDLRYRSGFDITQSQSGSGSGTTTGVLVDSQTIYNQINTSGSAKVIVSLDESTGQTTDWTSPASVNALHSEVATLQARVLSTLNASEFTLRHKLTNAAIFSGQITQAGLTKLLANRTVAHIEPVRTVYPMTAQGIPLMNASDTRSVYNGSGISIAIVDSGVDYTHPKLGGGAFPNSKVIGGWDFGDNDTDPMPTDSAHGTSCAGIAAGSLGTVGDYIGGVAPNAKIYALKIGDIPGFPSDYGLTAWDWCITHRNEDPANPILVISNSWRSDNWFSDTASADALSPAYTQAAQRAVSAGITILAASGNERYTNVISWPAAMSNVISVGAVYDADIGTSGMQGVCTDTQTAPDKVTCYSNTTEILDILAPSNNAYTTDIAGTNGYTTGDYITNFGGTSAACPYAAGAVAALQSAAKQLTSSYLTPAQVRTILTMTGDSITDTKVVITKPRVNLGAAIALLSPSTPLYAETGCTINGLELDANGIWIVSTSPDSNNISKDPNFVLGFYLSHIEAGQSYNSPCFDIGSNTAVYHGLNTYTTRTDGVKDTGIVDLGYHYTQGLPSYELQIDINTTTTGTGTTEAPWTPGTHHVYAGEIVRLHALPGPSSRVAMWVLDGVEFLTHDRYFNVPTNGSHHVVVSFEFYTPKSLIVPDEYETIQEAIDAAEKGDTIYVYRKSNGQPHYITNSEGLDFEGKAITIRSESPQDAEVVAQTVIDCQNQGRAFIFRNAEEANSIIDGFTITNCSIAGAIATGYQQDPIDGNVYNGADATGDGYGGAIYCGINTSPTIRNCVFSNCEVTGGRGNRGPDGYDLTENDPRDRGGRGGRGGNGFGNGYGGAIFCDQNSSPAIVNCGISNCVARGGVGGDGGDGGEGTTSKIGGDGGNGGDGSGLGYGGAIYCKNNARLKIVDCNFTDNTASMGLGGNRGLWGNGRIPDEPPYAQNGYKGASIGAGFAGAIYYKANTTVDINNCSFITNTAEADTADLYATGGGAIYCEANCVSITILKTNLSGNRTTQGSGGGIWLCANNKVNLTDCYFGGNTATDANGNGGALIIGTQGDANKCNLAFTNCAFTDNIAGNEGGGIYARNFDANFVDCYINRNTAAAGGGLYLIAQSTAKIYGGTIMQNKAIGISAEGGGAFISNLPIEIVNCQIVDNTSLYSGAGIMLKGPDTTTSKIHNCLFAKNSAGARGGALLISLGSSPKITSCTFSENGTEPGGAGGAVLCTHNSSPTIKDCIFDQTKRVAVYENSTDSDPNISYCMFYENFDGDFYDRDSGITYNSRDSNNPDVNLTALNLATGGHNRTGKKNNPLTPLFVTGDLGKYYLSQPTTVDSNIIKSPAVDGGSALAVDVNVLSGQTMADYTTRTDSNIVDAGDANQLDIGFHYIDIEPNWPRKFELTTAAVGGHGSVEPPSGLFYAGTTVEITALPNPGWRVNRWTGTDDDSSTNTTNYVIMIGKRDVTVSFEQPKNLHVPGEYPALQYAINDAKSGDKIILAKGTYLREETNYDYPWVYINGKNITITGTNPDDPCVVAQTIIYGNGFRLENVNKTMILDGITIQDAQYYASDVLCNEDWAHGPSGDGYNGYSIAGGGLRLYNASPTIRNCRFVNCSVLASNACNGQGEGDGGWAGFAWGGAAFIGPTSNPLFKNCQFINCYAQGSNAGNGAGKRGHGGNWGDPNANVDHTWDFADGLGQNGGYMEYWFYSGYGGAVYCMSGSKPQFEKCLFQGNRTYGGTCGISGTYNIYGYPMSHYAIDSFGGAVYIAAGSEANFTDCNFIDNEAHTRGLIPGSDPNIPNTNIIGVVTATLYSSVISYGGGICAEGTTTTIPVLKNCTFTNNKACAGGGIYWEDSSTHMSGCTFDNCVSMFGGAMLLLDSNSIIYECDFNGNQAIDPVGEGGAIYCASSAAKFYDCEINNNQSTTSGGGAYFTGGLEPNMHNCLITHNNAGRDGGGISVNWDTQLTLENCTIGHNAIGGSFASGFGGGLSCAYESNTKIINSILWNNNAAYGSEISIGSNFDAADKLKAEVTVSYSDVKGGAAGVFVDNAHGCKLNWDYTTNLAGTSLTNPKVVSGYFGDYYLSQPTDQNTTSPSPCVDSGSGLAIDNDMYRHTTRTDHVRVKGLAIDSNIVDMGYHYTLAAEILGDFNFDGVVDISDFILFEQYWMGSGCTFPYFCHERDLTEDGEVDFEDFAAFAENWNQEETTPPKPDPMTWAVRPRSVVMNEITMTATTARDNSGSLIQYYFDCYSGNCHDRSWDTNSAYTDSGLTEGNEYGYRVKAKDERNNETEWSVIAYAVPGDTPPQPDPMTWATAPYPTSLSSIRMVATTATDISGVEYYFDCVSPGCHDCDWQADTAYEDVGLEPNTTYTYRVKARDKSPSQNETQLSTPPASATTDINETPPLPVDMILPTYTPTVYGIWVVRPYAYYNSSTLYWYHRMTAVAATDSSLPLTYWFHCVSGFSDDYWTTNQGGVEVTYDAGPFTGQNYNTTYQVHIIDAAGNEVVSSAWRVYDSHF